MPLPFTKIRKQDGNTGVVKPGVDGIVAIISVSSGSQTKNVPQMYTDPTLIHTDKGEGPLTECAACIMPTAGNPVVVIQASPTTAGAYGSVTFTGTGTSVVTAHSATHPYDDYDALLTVILGGTIGTGPISFTYSLDGGVTTSGAISLGTANTYTIPNSGVELDFAAGTLVTGDTIEVLTTGPMLTSSDITTSLEALRTSGLPWECVLIDRIDASASSAALVAQADTWLAALEVVGKFRFFAVNTRGKNVGESEATFLSTMTTAFASAASIRGFVGADTFDSVSPITGLKLARPVSWSVVGRLMGSSLGRDPAYVNDGPISNCAINDVRNNPKHHNEQNYPGLDDIRLTTLRTINGETGIYITNGNVISASGSDYVFIQHVRTMNAGCEILYQELSKQLSKGVLKNPKPDPNTHAVYIQEGAAQEIESFCNPPIVSKLKTPGEVSDCKFILSRTDDLSSNQGAILTGTLQVEALAYVKGFNISAKFVKTIAVGG